MSNNDDTIEGGDDVIESAFTKYAKSKDPDAQLIAGLTEGNRRRIESLVKALDKEVDSFVAVVNAQSGGSAVLSVDDTARLKEIGLAIVDDGEALSGPAIPTLDSIKAKVYAACTPEGNDDTLEG